MHARLKPLLKPALTGFVFSAVATAWCIVAAGWGLPLYLGAILLAALYVPALTLAEPSTVCWISPLAVSLGIICCWLVSLWQADITPAELLRCALICLAFVAALAGIAALLTSMRFNPAPAAATTTLIALLWLTWPIWLSHALTQSRVNALSFSHPLLAINGVLSHLGAWDRATLAYQRLTILNQDIPYRLPKSIVPSIILHGGIAVVCFAIYHFAGPAPSPSLTGSPSPQVHRPL